MKPLDGITVISIEQAVAAPFATRQLADLGARVIKVERPGDGDFARAYDSTVNGMSSHFVWLNRSKESIVIDLKSVDGSRTIRRLIESADVFVQNLAPKVAINLGLGEEELHKHNPGLIHCSISGYGEGGPYSRKKAYDLLVQCESGLISTTGTADEPAKVGISIADIAAGMYAYSGILTALLGRLRSGIGATLEVSMLEALGEWMSYPMYYTMYGGAELPRTGMSHASIAPYGPFRCAAERQVFLGVQNEREWRKFCEIVLRSPELGSNPRFASNSKRVARREELTALISDSFATLSVTTVSERLDAAAIANAELRNVAQFTEHEQLVARERWREVSTPVGLISALIPPATINGDDPIMGPVPAHGEHTTAIMKELGFWTGGHNEN